MTAAVDTTPPQPASVDPEEVEKFSRLAATWWDPHGPFKPLHKFNPARLKVIRDAIIAAKALNPSAPRPFDGLRLLDIGCGGGLAAEPMARLGAAVTAVDASEKNVKTAATHAREQGLSIDYRCGTAEGLTAAGEPAFDVVLNLEVVEHVADPHAFLAESARLVAPGGVMIVATINRTPKAFATAIFGAEYVLGWLPRGTHQYAKLVRPDEVRAGLTAGGLTPEPPVGMTYRPLADRWEATGDVSVNYMITARRQRAEARSTNEV